VDGVVDTDALQAVALHRGATTARIAAILGTSMEEARERLEDLLAAGYVSGPDSSSPADEEFGWWLTDHGLEAAFRD
jgi:predicted ArsR family transcriptional regulator